MKNRTFKINAVLNSPHRARQRNIEEDLEGTEARVLNASAARSNIGPGSIADHNSDVLAESMAH